jgi:pyruvate dehydrogenase E1 component
MSAVPQHPAANDSDTLETQEWLDALEAVLEREGPERAHFLLERLVEKARMSGAYIPFSPYTPYVNTIPPHLEERSPGDVTLEERIRSICRWNAMVMVVRANKSDDELGGHIASFASVGTLFGTGQQHFWHAPHEGHGGDLVYFQGHSSPGVYARGLLEGRLTEEQLDNFRREVDGKGVSSYPHPWLMPDYWQFPTVSMGLGPIQAIYMARYLKYLHARGFADTANRKVWVFCGDGEMDEPESLGAIGMAARERLDNLVFIVNCNLQRLDGPVRGNGKIIQELEGDFRGAGWNVIKVIWGSYWDPLFARDKEGRLLRVMEDTVDGEYQNYKANDGAFVRKNFFGKDPRVLELVSRMTDEDIWRLNRGGHDPHKIYAAYAAAVKHQGQPTVILAKTIKGYGLGKQGQAKNPTHQLKKVDTATIKEMRDQFNIPIADDKLDAVPFFVPAPSCRSGAARPTRCRRCRRSRRSRRCSRARAKAARSRPPWRSCDCSRRWCVTRSWASASCPSCPTRRAPSAWRACSGSSASLRPRARSTSRWTATRSCTTARTRRARFWKRASTRRVPFHRGSRRRPRTATPTW